MNSTVDKIKRIINNNNITLPEIYAAFLCDNTADLVCSIKEEINDNIESISHNEYFIGNYHLFFYILIDKLGNNIEDFTQINYLLHDTIKSLKCCIKKYTKGTLPKDAYFHTVHSFIGKLERVLDYIDTAKEELEESSLYRMMWFIITELKNIDYLFRIIELHPEYINLKNKDRDSILKVLVEYIYANLKFWDSETIRYYKRVFVFFLESDELSLTNDELIGILSISETNLINTSIEVKKHIRFIINEINSHYEIINKDSRINAQSHVGKTVSQTLLIPTLDNRVDLRNEFTISIDAVRNSNIENRLIDDAYTLKELPNGEIELMIHIPDVGEFIGDCSSLDNHMRGLGESVYAHAYKTPLIPYDLATQMSLVKGEERPALTFIIKLDSTGQIIDFDMKKSLVRVNYNLTRRQADMFMTHNNDERLFVLNKLYEASVMLRTLRKEKIGNRRKGEIIMDEMNIYPDLLVASYCMENRIVLPYKNYAGKRSVRNVEHVSLCEKFATNIRLTEYEKEVLYSVFDIYNRVYYDTVFKVNKSTKNRPIGNVGNPLREYISLESDRMIKDIIIDKKRNEDFWRERIERDCIEYTETSAKIKQLYNPHN